MLGSHFDLDKEIAAIAARRAEQDKKRGVDHAIQDFDDRLRAFVRLLIPEGADGSSEINLDRKGSTTAQ